MLGLGRDAALVGFFARYQAEKRFDLFIEALANAAFANPASTNRRGRPRVHGVFVGRGAEPGNGELAALIGAHACGTQLAERVHLLGERGDVADLLPGMDVVANASDFEGFSNGLLEAMACGVPCVATAIDANVEALGDAGNLVDVGDPVGLGVAIARLLADPEECDYLARAGRARVCEHFTVDAWVDAFSRVIDRRETA